MAFPSGTFAFFQLPDTNIVRFDIPVHVVRLMQNFEWQQDLPEQIKSNACLMVA